MLLDARIVVLPVSDLGKARDWYSKVLQFAPHRATDQEVLFNGGGYDLRLVRASRAQRFGSRRKAAPTAGEPPEIAAVYWRVRDLTAALRRFRGAGAMLHSPAETCASIGTTATVRDPFGNVIGLVQEAADTTWCQLST